VLAEAKEDQMVGQDMEVVLLLDRRKKILDLCVANRGYPAALLTDQMMVHAICQ
jgi:hypothetical protein